MKKIARDGKTIIEEKDKYYISDDYPRGFASLIANKYNSGDDTYGYEVAEIFDYIYTKFYSNTNDKKCVVIDFNEWVINSDQYKTSRSFVHLICSLRRSVSS